MKYYVAFLKTEKFWKHFTKAGFGHIVLFFKDEYNWMKVESHMSYLDFQVLDYPLSTDIPKIYSEKGNKVLEIDVERKRPHRIIGYFHFIPGVLTCVNSTIWAMGIKIRAFTPYGLYKKLLRYGHMSEQNRKKTGFISVRELN